MSNQLAELMNRLQKGDHTAAAELVAAYEPELRRYVRFRMSSPQMRRLVESADISQSVFAKFFVDIQSRAGCPESPQQLRRLLITMTRNKINDHVRHHQAAKRDMRRVQTGVDAIESAYDKAPMPDEALVTKETLEAVRDEMTAEELALVNARLDGQAWSEVANELRVSPEAARKRFARIIESVAQRVEHFEDPAQ
jgi:RNA polymerase sigma factor (sigma-70 family)